MPSHHTMRSPPGAKCHAALAAQQANAKCPQHAHRGHGCSQAPDARLTTHPVLLSNKQPRRAAQTDSSTRAARACNLNTPLTAAMFCSQAGTSWLVSLRISSSLPDRPADKTLQPGRYGAGRGRAGRAGGAAAGRPQAGNLTIGQGHAHRQHPMQASHCKQDAKRSEHPPAGRLATQHEAREVNHLIKHCFINQTAASTHRCPSRRRRRWPGPSCRHGPCGQCCRGSGAGVGRVGQGGAGPQSAVGAHSPQGCMPQACLALSVPARNGGRPPTSHSIPDTPLHPVLTGARSRQCRWAGQS